MSSSITAAICTWNRAALLSQTLETLTRMTVTPDLKWELLVVNNQCTDQTDQVLASFASRLPVKRLYEPMLGLSHARNRAVAAATGDYILWTDDDVLVDERWLSEYHTAFQRFPDAVLFGGPVYPRYASPPPAWLQRMWSQVAMYYAIRECCGRSPCIASDYVPYGANYALRMDVQRKHLYEPGLGRKGSLLYSGEEWQVVTAILKEGGVGRWLADAPVEHWLPAERLTTAYLRRVIRCHGEIGAGGGATPDRFRLLGRPLKLWRRVAMSELRYRVYRAIATPEVWFPHFQKASFLQGQFRGYHRSSPVAAQP